MEYVEDLLSNIEIERPLVEERRVRRQAGVFTCLTVRWRCLVVELQRKLDVSRRLREVNNSKCVSAALETFRHLSL
jgi:hypothetical protein